jgi:hypothetical protein
MKEIGNADPFWDDLLLKIDDEITRLENLAQPDQIEFSILKQIDVEPKNLDIQFELV